MQARVTRARNSARPPRETVWSSTKRTPLVATGTVPPAYPLRAGQHWTTEVDGLPLPGLSLTAV